MKLSFSSMEEKNNALRQLGWLAKCAGYIDYEQDDTTVQERIEKLVAAIHDPSNSGDAHELWCILVCIQSTPIKEVPK